MALHKVDSALLIEKSAELFRIQGYHHTSIADIANYCGLSKASLYHHFSSKKELAILAISHVHSYFKDNIFCCAYAKNLSEHERLTIFLDALEQYYIGRVGGCIIGNFALELVSIEPDFRQYVDAFFTDWIDALCCIFKKIAAPKLAKDLANNAVRFTQGFILMSCIYNDLHVQFKMLRQQLLVLFQTKHESNKVFG